MKADIRVNDKDEIVNMSVSLREGKNWKFLFIIKECLFLFNFLPLFLRRT